MNLLSAILVRVRGFEMGIWKRFQKFCLLYIKLPFDTVLMTMLSLIVLFASVYLSIKFPEKLFFQRSGSILVLLGAVISYRQITRNFGLYIEKLIEDPQEEETAQNLIENGDLILGFSRAIEIVLILAGTFIWGYGDFLI